MLAVSVVMTVVDSNILTYLYLPCEFSEAAEALLQRKAEWAAPGYVAQ